MKRLAIKLVVFLLLGAVTTVGVAWSSVWWAPLPVTDVLENNPAVESQSAAALHGPNYFVMRIGRQRRIGADRVWSSWLDPDAPVSVSFISDPHIRPEHVAPSWARLALPTPEYADGDVHERTVEARGWPLIALRSGYVHRRNLVPGGPPFLDASETRVGAWPLRDLAVAPQIMNYGAATMPAVSTVQHLPLHPMWPGFLINTFFYAVILWLLWSTPFATRRLTRKRRGRCVRCGYDLRHAEHEACPECGSVSQRQS